MKRWLFAIVAVLLLTACSNAQVVDTDSSAEPTVLENETSDTSSGEIAGEESNDLELWQAQSGQLVRIIIAYLQQSDFKDDQKHGIDMVVVFEYLSEHMDVLDDHLMNDLMELVTRFDGIYAELYSDLMLKLFIMDGDRFIEAASEIGEEKSRFIQGSIAYANSYFPESEIIEILLAMKDDSNKSLEELSFINGLITAIESFN